jgi:hypothetical protein
MTDYNDGEWHEWNGGECPVDPRAWVEVWYDCGVFDDSEEIQAGELDWSHNPTFFPITRFRVIKSPIPATAEPELSPDPLADLAARVEKLEAIINAIVAQRGGE